jgi:hypothetical protein
MLAVLSLSVIRLYLDNPRLSKSESETEALYKIVADQQKKLVLLAKDIVKHKLSELDVMAVFPDQEEGYYRVAEGNRRITALKLLQNPSLINERFPSIAKEISEIEGRENIDFEHINVSVFPSEYNEELIHFLQIRHLGEYGGVGTVRWDAKQKGRFNYRVYGTENLVIFLDELERKGILTVKQINGVTKTNWDRILRPIGLGFFHLNKVDGTYQVLEGYLEEFTQKIRMVADALYNKTVAIVYDQTCIEKFFYTMEQKYNGNIDCEPDKKWPGDGESISGGASAGHEEVTPTEEEKPPVEGERSGRPTRRMPRDPYKDCPYVIPTAVRIQSRNHRITRIIQELKDIPVEKYPNACGCLLRALIELSAKEYLEHINHRLTINGDATKLDFKDAIFAALDDMVNKELIQIGEGRRLRRETEAGGVRQLFNGYMHNTDSYPSPILIQGVFQSYSEFLSQCLF